MTNDSHLEKNQKKTQNINMLSFSSKKSTGKGCFWILGSLEKEHEAWAALQSGPCFFFFDIFACTGRLEIYLESE